MPAVDLTRISSNWKALQAQLKGNDAAQSKNGSLKRKRRTEVVQTKQPSIKRYKTTPTSSMGSVLSSGDAGHERRRLQNEFDIPKEDVDGVFGHVSEEHVDEINGGRHATHKAGRYLALDCEMVGTGPPPHTDDLLARVSIVNFHGQQIYDSYVQPVAGSKVEDYRTHVSGIRREHLRPGVARPFREVQKDVFDLLQGNILVGHALRKDLQALQLDHPKRDVRDTSRYPAYRIESKGKPPALRHLAKTHLRMTIQKGEHSSLEDARATMLLYRREKTGFEAENRKQFGAARPAKPVKQTASDDDDLDEDEEDDEAEDDGTATQETISQRPTKKRKKKKRTKR